MELRLRDEQVALRESYDALLEKTATTERLRALAGAGFDPDLWAKFCRMGAPGIAVAEADGGDGAGLAEAAVICEQIGRHVAAVPFVDTCVAVRLLAKCGSPLLADVLSGDLRATVSLRPATDGEWRFVPSGSLAALVIGLDGDDLVAVRAECAPDPLPNLADLPLCHRTTTGDRVVLATGPAARTLHAHALDEWRTLAAATLTGIAAGASLHFHGGYGFMLEYDIQLYFRRIKAWALLAGDRQHALLDVADALWS